MNHGDKVKLTNGENVLHGKILVEYENRWVTFANGLDTLLISHYVEMGWTIEVTEPAIPDEPNGIDAIVHTKAWRPFIRVGSPGFYGKWNSIATAGPKNLTWEQLYEEYLKSGYTVLYNGGIPGEKAED